MRNEESLLVPTEALPMERQQRLAKILDEYLIATEQGAPVSPDELLAQNPEDAVYLRDYLSGLKLFHDAAHRVQDLHSTGSQSAVFQTPGQQIGDYRLIREVGRGGMGVVYEAEQVSLKRRVALKILPYVAANNEQHLQRFHAESLAAASIEHPNIVPVHAIGEDQGVHFYAMQFIVGKSLSQLFDQQRGPSNNYGSTTTVPAAFHSSDRIPILVSATQLVESTQAESSVSLGSRDSREQVREIARLGIQAADALHAAHEYGVVHRDVKPSNLLLDESGKLWITDFGLARCREGSGLTQTGDILGTLRYMSPEQASGAGKIVDHRTDIFSLGVTLYEAAAEQHPFGDDDLAIFAQDRRPSQPLTHWDRRIPKDFETIIMKAIAYLPADRYATGEDLAADLRRFLADEPILARRPSLLNRAGKWAKRHRGAVLSATAALIVAVAALSIALVAVARSKTKIETHYGRSQERLQQTRQVLDEDFRLAEQLAAIPGAAGVRHQLLDKNLKYYQQIAAQAADDPALVSEVALAYSKIGDLTAETGDFKDALNYHQQAKAALECLLVQDGSSDELQRSLAVCMNNIGMAFFNLGQEQEAFQSCAAALEVQQRLLGHLPESTELLTDLAATYTNLGLVHKRRRSTEDAANAFSQALALQERVSEATQSEQSLRKLALGYANLASIHDSSDGPAARDYYGQAVSIQKTLVESQPLNLIYQCDLARSFNNLGYLAAQEKDWKSAELCYDDAIKILEQLVHAAPTVAAYRRDLAVSQNNLGRTLVKIDRHEDARNLFVKASVVQRQLLKMNPDDLQALMSLGGILNNIGMLFQQQDQLTAASTAFHQAVEYQRRALEQSPRSERVREFLNNHLFNYAKCSHRLGDTEKALSIALRRRTLWQESPERLLSVVKEILSFRSDGWRVAETEPRTDQRLLEMSVDTLSLALERGLPAERLHDQSLADLRSTQQFQAMMLDSPRRGSQSEASHAALGGIN